MEGIILTNSYIVSYVVKYISWGRVLPRSELAM